MRQSVCFLLVILLPLVAQAQDLTMEDDFSSSEVDAWAGETGLSLETHFTVSGDGEVRPELDLLVTRTISDVTGVWLFAAGTTWYAQSYGGFFTMPVDWLMIGAGIGLETVGSTWRAAAMLDIRLHGFHLAGVFEIGASGRWHHLRATYQAGDRFLFGVMSQRGEGEGLLIGVVIDFVEIRLAYLYDTERYLDEGRSTDLAWWNNRFFTAMLSIGINILP
ncbi:MAG: hypothetical protein V1738_02960 [Patescibacteria group bacterium]